MPIQSTIYHVGISPPEMLQQPYHRFTVKRFPLAWIGGYYRAIDRVMTAISSTSDHKSVWRGWVTPIAQRRQGHTIARLVIRLNHDGLYGCGITSDLFGTRGTPVAHPSSRTPCAGPPELSRASLCHLAWILRQVTGDEGFLSLSLPAFAIATPVKAFWLWRV